MADRQRAGRIVAGGLVLWLASCAEPAASELVVEHRMPVQPEVTVAATEQMRAAPSRSSALRDGACATQADCPQQHLCVATSPARAECFAASEVPELRAPRPGPAGQPAPPIGLLDGQAMRDHAERSMP